MNRTDLGGTDAWRVGVLLREVQQREYQAMDAALAPLSVSMAQFVALHAVENHPDRSAHDLAVLTSQTDQSFGSLMRRLVEAGLVERTPGARRTHHHRLTAAGRELVDACRPVVTAALGDAFGPLSAAELAHLRGYLERLRAAQERPARTAGTRPGGPPSCSRPRADERDGGPGNRPTGE